MSTILGQKEMAAMTFALRLKGILSFAADATTCVAWLTLVTSTAPILAISFLPIAVAAQLGEEQLRLDRRLRGIGAGRGGKGGGAAPTA